MKKRLLFSLLLITTIFMITGCGNSIKEEAIVKDKKEEIEENKEEEKNVEPLSTNYYGFDLEKLKPNMGGEIYNKDVNVEMAIQGKVSARFYGEYISKVSTYDEDTVYAVKVFNYCKSIASNNKVYQSVGRFKNPDSADLKEVKSVKEAEEISNTFTWSIKLDGNWYIITIAGDQNKNKPSIGVRIVRL